MENVDLDRGSELTVDLEAVDRDDPDGGELSRSPSTTSTRYRILNGLDDIALTLEHEARSPPTRRRTAPRA